MVDRLNEWIFPDNGPDVGQPGPLTEQKYIAHDQTKISAYWPHIVYQGFSGELRAVDYACHEKTRCWHESVLRTTEAKNGTQLVTLPFQNNMSTQGLFYQEEEGRVIAHVKDDKGDEEMWESGM